MEIKKAETQKKAPFAFLALDPVVEDRVVRPTETAVKGKDFIAWGDGNNYPDYIEELGRTSSTLRSVINGIADFVAGDDVTATFPQMIVDGVTAVNRRGETIADLVRTIARSLAQFGGFAVHVSRNSFGEPVEVEALPMPFVRSDKENEVFFYSEDWGARAVKSVTYPRFIPGTQADESQTDTVVFVKQDGGGTYPVPAYVAATIACEIERAIDEYNLNQINNGFMGSYVLNFNNGQPEDEVKEEIERGVKNKWAGYKNAGRIMCVWNDTKESAATIERLEPSDFGDKYDALWKACRQRIFTAFRANPNLFGIPTESLGFSSEEYDTAFRLFNRTTVRPMQRLICDTFDRIFGAKGCVTIRPFSIEGNATTDTAVQ